MACGGSEVQPRPQVSESPASVSRAGPAKVTEVAEKCAVLDEQELRGFGVDQPPRERDVSGMWGCEYQGTSDDDQVWSAAVALNGHVSYKAELNRRAEPTGSSDLKGYPGKTFRNGMDCTLIADISDRGFLVANGTKVTPGDRGPDPCVIAEQLGGMAVLNLPDEPAAG
ncbi:DUF3558 family protein [Saccharopolyspora dendranthemae]|uniref:DUF3558 family protein n=1 Tax=Saccharopolyspora dendranthemae TaxID=1181886 RepID=UPI0024830935|nr:DUF3558 family protein [Saccharopolyspora dendranthemae]